MVTHAQGGLLKDKLCLVTGASRGIGRSIAEAYAEQAGQLILTAEPGQEADLHKAAEACNKRGAHKTSVKLCNLAEAAQIDRLTQDILKEHPGGVNVLVNNAGVLGPIDYAKGDHMGQGPLDGDPREWEQMLQVNVVANMRLVRALCPAMRDKGEGYVVNINSSNGLKGGPATAAYCASKWGQRGWALSCHEALKEFGIRVVTIYPPAVSTHMTWDRPDMDPITELEAQPGDVAKAALLPFKFSQNALPVEIMLQTLRNYKK